MALSSYCRNCGAPYTTVSEMEGLRCIQCEEARKAAMQHAKEKNPEASESDLLYVGREALMQRATHPRQTYLSPRDHNAATRNRG